MVYTLPMLFSHYNPELSNYDKHRTAHKINLLSSYAYSMVLYRENLLSPQHNYQENAELKEKTLRECRLEGYEYSAPINKVEERYLSRRSKEVHRL